ncbi:MAG: hypothetical protein KGI46_06430 [Alphaproteobacteria bacterium]|nr:hypothetical protein [Alphaproteobacteria bacterium]
MTECETLRDQSRVYLERAMRETDPRFKQLLARHALALAQLAEQIERRYAEATAEPT